MLLNTGYVTTHRAQGYVTDTTYTETFFRELSPVWLNYVACLRGASPRDLDRFTYLELGCGLGNSVITNAGAFPHSEFHACDVNTTHIEHATRRAAAFGIANVTFYEASFQDLLARDLPEFDYIVLHGVYSWVGAESRAAIRRLIGQKLKPGGLAYVSYNCWPAWAAEAPLRRLLLELAASERGDTQARTESALASLKRLSTSKVRYFRANPAAMTAVEAYVREPRRYLVHEFLNDTWDTFYSIDVADEMAAIGMTYLGSATLADDSPSLVIDDATAGAVAALKNTRQQELAMDFAVNRRLRRDVFIRSDALRERRDPERAASHMFLDAVIIGTIDNPERISGRVRVPRGVLSFQDAFIRDVQALMALGSLTLADAVVALGRGRHAQKELARNFILLVAAGVLMPFARAHRYDVRTIPRKPANTVVRHMLAYAVAHAAPCALPSTIVGNGVLVQPLEALALTELERAQDVAGLAARLYAEIKRRGLQVPDSAIVHRDEELLAISRRTAVGVLDQVAPRLARAGLLV